MKLVPTGRGSEIVERYDNKVCTGCHGLLVAPHVQLGSMVCYCQPGERLHRTLTCMDCHTVHIEGPHVTSA